MKNNKPKKIIYLEKILRFMAIATLKMHKPKIVGITGSVGKSSTKEAVFKVLSSNFKARKNEENYNNEIGIPLTIIGAKTGGKNPLKWLLVFLKWICGLVIPFRYPKFLVLEMAIDRPGDMRYLVDFIPAEVGILTDVSASHLEFFDSINSIAREKSILIKELPKNGLAILNTDNEIIKKLKGKIDIKVVDFGIKSDAKISATDIQFVYGDDNGKLKGLSFKLNQDGNFAPIRLTHIIAEHHLYAVLAAIAVGSYFKINLVDIAESLENLKPPHGRMTPINGMKEGLIIDDTYNASPVSTKAALETVSKIMAHRRVAILGDMMELGESSESGHVEIVKEVLDKNFDVTILVGCKFKKAALTVMDIMEVKKEVIYFDSPDDVIGEIENIIRSRDVILVKGSQSMRMEKIVEQLMDDPKQAKQVLCRQSKVWKNKPFIA